jgi:hypothetical protein
MDRAAIERMLIVIAQAMYGEIMPCSRRPSLDECFHDECGRLYLYFNTVDNSTRVVSAYIPFGNIPKCKGF